MSDYFDLGTYSCPITTASPQAQLWFDRGLMWGYGYNPEEAIRCFQTAAAHDPACAMAYWGHAYVRGSGYNLVWDALSPDELEAAVADCYRLSRQATTHAQHVSPVERALIHALPTRYQSPRVATRETFAQWSDAYAAAMRTVYMQFPEDLDVIALFADALINRTPWMLWDINTGKPAEGADTLEAIDVLEKGLRLVESRGLAPHPGLLHIYIHTLEMSPYPERALRASDALCDLVPDAGHLRHMPSHIYIQCGHYYEALEANNRAIAADQKYADREEPHAFYTLSRCHDYHFKMYAAMFLGQYQPALEAADGITATLTEEVLRARDGQRADILEGYYSTRMHVLVRFGKWQDIIDAPMPDDPQLYCVTTVMYHYAKGVAYAAQGQLEAAEEQRQRFDQAYAKVPPTRRFFGNFCIDTLSVAEAMLNGEVEYRKGHYEAAFAHLRQAVERNDHLAYTEPWAWMHPPRHALGALLLEQGYVTEAEHVYRADLGFNQTLSRVAQHPGNVWSLYGYVECLKRQGKHEQAAAFQLQLNLALARMDVDITSSCFCSSAHP